VIVATKPELKVFLVFLPGRSLGIEIHAESVSIEPSGVLSFHSADTQGQRSLIQAFAPAGWLSVKSI
jgi:hypothetical protein